MSKTQDSFTAQAHIKVCIYWQKGADALMLKKLS